MDLIGYLEQLADERVSISGTYATYGIKWEIRMLPDRSGICIKWQPRGNTSGMSGNPRLHIIRHDGIITAGDLHRAVVQKIDEMISAENDRFEEEACALSSASEESMQLAADMAAYDF